MKTNTTCNNLVISNSALLWSKTRVEDQSLRLWSWTLVLAKLDLIQWESRTASAAACAT